MQDREACSNCRRRQAGGGNDGRGAVAAAVAAVMVGGCQRQCALSTRASHPLLAAWRGLAVVLTRNVSRRVVVHLLHSILKLSVVQLPLRQGVVVEI